MPKESEQIIIENYCWLLKLSDQLLGAGQLIPINFSIEA